VAIYEVLSAPEKHCLAPILRVVSAHKEIRTETACIGETLIPFSSNPSAMQGGSPSCAKHFGEIELPFATWTTNKNQLSESGQFGKISNIIPSLTRSE
jgi:hypothetical protein